MIRTPLSRSKGQSHQAALLDHHGLNASSSCSDEHGNVLGVGNYCYVAVCSAVLGASAPAEGGDGPGISWRPPAYRLSRPHCCSPYTQVGCVVTQVVEWTVEPQSNRSCNHHLSVRPTGSPVGHDGYLYATVTCSEAASRARDRHRNRVRFLFIEIRVMGLGLELGFGIGLRFFIFS